MNNYQNEMPQAPEAPKPLPDGYWCPRCGRTLKRATSNSAGMLFGLVGALIAAAFFPLKCNACGPIPTRELHPVVRRRYRTYSLIMVASALLVLAIALFLIVISNSK